MFSSNVRLGLGGLAALGLVACEVGDQPDAPRRAPSDGDYPALLAAPPMDAAVLVPASTTSDAAAPACTISPDCESAPLVFVDAKACCTPTTSCGFEVTGGTREFREAVASAVGLGKGETCAPRERYFIEHESIDEMRVATEAGKDILLSSSCNSTSILSITFAGCCMPNDRCGVSTYGIWDTIAVLAPTAPFAKLQCVSSSELNSQIAESQFRGLHHLRDTDAPCDYAALDAELSPAW